MNTNKQIEDGGSAFPTLPINCNDPADEWKYNGMKLRDYFAAKAMQALVAEKDGEFDRLSEVPEYAYQIADAMIAARKGGV